MGPWGSCSSGLLQGLAQALGELRHLQQCLGCALRVLQAVSVASLLCPQHAP